MGCRQPTWAVIGDEQDREKGHAPPVMIAVLPLSEKSSLTDDEILGAGRGLEWAGEGGKVSCAARDVDGKRLLGLARERRGSGRATHRSDMARGSGAEFMIGRGGEGRGKGG